MSEGEPLPTAEELAEIYGEYELGELIDIAGDVDAHAELVVLRDARRIHKLGRLARALNLPVVREERQRQYALKLEAETEYDRARLKLRGVASVMLYGATPPPSDASEQSAAPSE